ncbi:MAG: EscU/YscU/HrcU family type III secretion system export apparatus switch protein [Legionella sp.]|nr:EscU/YscU/HrcU family type III secretion system export apparatus switch protein [Legionella sp.]
MSEDAQEKQYQPSLKRLEELKKKGTFLRSKDFNSGLILVIAILLIVLMSPVFHKALSHHFTASFSLVEHADFAVDPLEKFYRQLAFNTLFLLLPILMILFIVPFFMGFLFGGFGFSMNLLTFKGDRLNPLKNLKKIFSANNVIEVIKSAFKMILFFLILGGFVYLNCDELIQLSAPGSDTVLYKGLGLVGWYLWFIAAGISLIASIDMGYSYLQHQKKIKMSHQEVKDENKETDGNPENKRRIRQAQFAMARQRIHQDVPSATVIITNPTHYAVALRYDEKKDNAPRIMAAGINNIAAEIRLMAVKHAIPIYEAPPLARALYHTGQVGDYIHQELYMSVAIVLSYIAQLKNYQTGVADKPSYVSDLQIPKEFYFEK